MRKFLDRRDLSGHEKQGLAKAFEYTCEPAWNAMKDFLTYKGHQGEMYGPRAAIRQAFAAHGNMDGIVTSLRGGVFGDFRKKRRAAGCVKSRMFEGIARVQDFGTPRPAVRKSPFSAGAGACCETSNMDEAVLHGSRAKGDHRPGSDIDLALKGDGIDLERRNAIASALDDLLLPCVLFLRPASVSWGSDHAG